MVVGGWWYVGWNWVANKWLILGKVWRGVYWVWIVVIDLMGRGESCGGGGCM